VLKPDDLREQTSGVRRATYSALSAADPSQGATVLATVQVRPRNVGARLDLSAPADLDGGCARRPRTPQGRDEGRPRSNKGRDPSTDIDRRLRATAFTTHEHVISALPFTISNRADNFRRKPRNIVRLATMRARNYLQVSEHGD
jgi:hypothetical protein